MHTTDTIDFEWIVSGEIWLDLDDGATVQLHAADAVGGRGRARFGVRARRTAVNAEHAKPAERIGFVLGSSANHAVDCT